jgi:carbohydrate kinase (thermoresistant glucokinase family)
MHAVNDGTPARPAATESQPAHPGLPVVLVLMGVSGCGKTTIAQLLAQRLGWPWQEGDALHPPANVAKMAAGHPLTDEDRWPWLERIAAWIEHCLDEGRSGIVTCSALKRAYRDRLNRRGKGVLFVYLAGAKELIARRLTRRHDHFMPASLLDSQFATLEEPSPDEPVLRVDIGAPAEVIADTIIRRLGLDALARDAR